MSRHFLASPKYGLLHTLDMPTPCEEHLRRRLGTLSVSLAYASLLLCYWSDPARHDPAVADVWHGANEINQ